MSFTDFEESIVFDKDDPDFDNNNKYNINILSPINGSTAAMSLAGVHPLNNRSQSFNSVSSLEDVPPYLTSEPVLSIEELRLQLNSCFTCGVLWQEDHVSLDCTECGGYSLERPCPLCDGHCSSVWKRDLTMSHASGKAKWEGACSLHNPSKGKQPVILFKSLSPEEEKRLSNRFDRMATSS